MKKNFRRKTCVFLLLYFFSQHAWARPFEVEVWFLSIPEGAKLVEFMQENGRAKLALVNLENIHSQCQLMGDFYFHPQFGAHEHENPLWAPPSSGSINLEDDSPEGKGKKSKDSENTKYLSDWENKLIQCDKNYHFDFFCGHATSSSQDSPLEIWIDTSSSLVSIDSPQGKNDCFRKSFIKSLRNECPKDSFDVRTFTISLKKIANDDYICQQYGLNDAKRMIEWIEASKSKKLIIITDIYEYTLALSDYIESIGGKFYGENPSAKLFPKGLLDMVSKVRPSCQSLKKEKDKN